MSGYEQTPAQRAAALAKAQAKRDRRNAKRLDNVKKSQKAKS